MEVWVAAGVAEGLEVVLEPELLLRTIGVSIPARISTFWGFRSDCNSAVNAPLIARTWKPTRSGSTSTPMNFPALVVSVTIASSSMGWPEASRIRPENVTRDRPSAAMRDSVMGVFYLVRIGCRSGEGCGMDGLIVDRNARQ